MATTTLTPSADNWMNQASVNQNNGGSASLYIGERNDSAVLLRALVKFNLTSIPAGNTVDSATLRLYLVADWCSNARTLSAYRCLRAWEVDTSCWANWKAANAWTAGGADDAADRETTVIGSVALGDAEGVGWKDIPLTPALVKEWLVGTLANNGMVLRVNTELNDCYIYESAEGAHPPQLVVVHHPSGASPMWIF